MDPTLGLVGFLVFILLIALRVPIAFAMAFVGVTGLSFVYGWEGVLKYVPDLLYQMTSNFSFAALPLFFLMGFLAYQADISKDSYDAAKAWLGRVPGGAAVATVYACALFGACCGSGYSECAVFSKIAVPEMMAIGYNRKLSLGVVAGASGLAVLIPPSILMVVYGVMTETSVGQLLIAGVLPGILYACVLAVAIIVLCSIKPSYAPQIKDLDTSWKNKIRTLKKIWVMALLILCVVGAIYFGLATPDESAAVGVAGSILILVLRKKFSLRLLIDATLDAAKTSAMIFLLIGSAIIFTTFISVTGFVSSLTGWFISLNLGFFKMMVMVVLLYLVLGCFLDSISMMVLTLPLVIPLIQSFGASTIWFGVILTVLIMVGTITPPMGMNIYVMKGALGSQVELSEIFLGALPFCILMLITIVILTIFPEIATWLPSVMFSVK